jgi:hypothetical protein
MARRTSQRIPVSLEGRLSCQGQMYIVYVGNMSPTGLYVRIPPVQTNSAIYIPPEADLRLRLELPSGCLVYLTCRKKWSLYLTPHATSKKVGLEIIDPPREYLEFAQAHFLKYTESSRAYAIEYL